MTESPGPAAPNGQAPSGQGSLGASVLETPPVKRNGRRCHARTDPDLTSMLHRPEIGEPPALDALLPVVYGELRELAVRFLRGERPEHALQPAALVHEAYIRLAGCPQVHWRNRAHFFATATTVIRRILLKHARAKNCAKRGEAWRRVRIDEDVTAESQDSDIIALGEALGRLSEFAPQKLRIIELRFFAGLSVAETADVLGVSPRTVARDWRLARAWLRLELAHEAVDEV